MIVFIQNLNLFEPHTTIQPTRMQKQKLGQRLNAVIRSLVKEAKCRLWTKGSNSDLGNNLMSF